MGRTVYSLRNMATSVFGIILNDLLRFICRTVFLYTLGAEYLGISSLYTNILTLLSIAELGFSSAVTYSLYQPLAEGDEAKIRSIMAFYRKAYRIIGIAVFGIGLCLIPFLPYLMTGATDVINIYEYYILYLIQTSVSYLFFAYKATLLNADQKKYVTDLISYCIQILMNLIQIAVLLLWGSFFVYTVVMIVCSILTNIVTAWAVDRRYPYLKKPAEPLSKSDRHDVFRRIWAMFLYRISNAVGNATDNLIISAFLGVVTVGIYNNYYMIMRAVQNFLSNLFRSFSSSLGNLYVLESREKNEFTFRCLNHLNTYVVTLCSVCFLVMFQPFIRLWIGEQYLLSDLILVILVLNFSTNFLQTVVQIYKEASGVFVEGRYRAVATAVLNLVISILLTREIGLAGVFLGSIISRLVTTGWYDPWLLCRRAFGKSPAGYYLESLISIGLTFALGGAIFWLCRPITNNWAAFFVRGALAVALTTLLFWLYYRKSDEYAFIRGKAVAWRAKRRARKHPADN